MFSDEKLNAMRRIKEEYSELANKSIDNIGATIGLVDEHDIFEWKATLTGPKDSSYAGGIFLLRIKFPDNYPKKPPDVYFITPMYHVNINPLKLTNVRLGHVCINTLNHWKPETSMREVLKEIFALFYVPNPNSPYGLDRADELRFNKPLHEAKIKYFTQKYANPSLKQIEYNANWDFTYPYNLTYNKGF